MIKYGKYNRLDIIKDLGNINQKRYVECRCDCGVVAKYQYYHIIAGRIKSCGCYKSEVLKKKMTVHGKYKTKLYAVWCQIRDKCNNPNSTQYDKVGGKGIKMIKAWDSYKVFENWALSNGWKEGCAVSRIDQKKDYSPGNCIVTDKKTAARTRENVIKVRYKGVTKPLIDWAEELNISKQVLYARIRQLGWSVEKAFETPVYGPV